MKTKSDPLFAFAFVLLSAFMLTSCDRKPIDPIISGCVQPPPKLQEVNKPKAFEVSGKLEHLKIDSSLKLNFEHLVKQEWAALNDDNVALYLFLKAIECFGKRDTPFDQEVARTLLKIVRDKYASQAGISSFDPKLTGIEKAKVKQAPFASELETLCANFDLL